MGQHWDSRLRSLLLFSTSRFFSPFSFFSQPLFVLKKEKKNNNNSGRLRLLGQDDEEEDDKEEQGGGGGASRRRRGVKGRGKLKGRRQLEEKSQKVERKVSLGFVLRAKKKRKNNNNVSSACCRPFFERARERRSEKAREDEVGGEGKGGEQGASERARAICFSLVFSDLGKVSFSPPYSFSVLFCFFVNLVCFTVYALERKRVEKERN